MHQFKSERIPSSVSASGLHSSTQELRTVCKRDCTPSFFVSLACFTRYTTSTPAATIKSSKTPSRCSTNPVTTTGCEPSLQTQNNSWRRKQITSVKSQKASSCNQTVHASTQAPPTTHQITKFFQRTLSRTREPPQLKLRWACGSGSVRVCVYTVHHHTVCATHTHSSSVSFTQQTAAPKNVRQKQKNIIPTGNFLSFFDFHRQPVWPSEQKELTWLEIFGLVRFLCVLVRVCFVFYWAVRLAQTLASFVCAFLHSLFVRVLRCFVPCV
jgi:hypothetical protein